MYFITIKRMLEVCFLAHPNIQYRAKIFLSPAIVVWLEIFLCGFGLQVVPVF